MTSISRLFDIPYHQLQQNNLEDCLVTKVNGVWIKTSTEEYLKKANKISRAFLKLGLKINDKIAIISSSNRTEWHIIDIGILQLGAQNVPIYPTISDEEYEYILNHSEVKYCFVSDEVVLQKVLNRKKNLPHLKEIYSFENIHECKNWCELLILGEDLNNDYELEQRKQNVKPNDLATLIYTSGTTGKPKGVMLSHNNIVSNILDSASRIPFDEGKGKALSFLPICHSYERMVTYLYQYYSISIYFGESLDKIGENIKEVQPSVMTGVPRLIEKVYEKIITKGNELNRVKKLIFLWAIKIGVKYEAYGQNGWWYGLKLKIARLLILKKWKEGLGGNLNLIVSGASGLQPRLARIFAAAEIYIVEGYGLTETSPVISVNDIRNFGFKPGTVGKPLPNQEIKIANDGEILCKGPNIMMGYYKEEQLTREVIKNGYFHTGDIGNIDDEGFLSITDRKKEIFKTSGGKYIAPQLIENELKQSRFIEQVMVIGEGQKMPAALIQPNFEFIKEWANSHNFSVGNSYSEIIENVTVLERIQKDLDTINEKFGNWEKIKRFELTSDVWTIQAGHLTPTMKLKRKVVLEKYMFLYNKIYHQF